MRLKSSFLLYEQECLLADTVTSVFEVQFYSSLFLSIAVPSCALSDLAITGCSREN